MIHQFKFKTMSIFFVILAGISITTCAKSDKNTFAGIEMVLVPTGKVPSFYIGKYELTQKQYQDVMEVNPSEFKNQKNPVENVSWYDAIEFCNKLSIKAGFKPYYNIDKNNIDTENKLEFDKFKWLVTINKEANGFRLPLSEEWEYAARAGTATKYYWGDSDDIAVIDKYAFYVKNAYIKNAGKDRTVGMKKPNAWGVYDIAGNVAEWCFDLNPVLFEFQKKLGNSNSKFDKDLLNSLYFRILRGGSWYSEVNDLESGKLSGQHPYKYTINDRSGTVGIRLAKNL